MKYTGRGGGGGGGVAQAPKNSSSLLLVIISWSLKPFLVIFVVHCVSLRKYSQKKQVVIFEN